MNRRFINNPQREPILDLLRFLAALAVVFVHVRPIELAGALNNVYFLNWLLQNGNIGVDVFFIISGYVIVQSAEKYSFKDFVLARLIRILPVLWLVTIASFCYFYITDTPKPSFKVLLDSLTLTFSLNPNTAIPPQIWTLVYEFRFYFIIAMIILLKAKIHMTEALQLALLTGYSFFIFLTKITFSETSPNSYLYFNISNTSMEYIGILFCIGSTLSIINRSGLAKAYLLLILNYLLLFNLHEYNSVSKVILIVLSVLILGRFQIRNEFIRGLFLMLGRISYPLYLIHYYSNVYIIEHLNVFDFQIEYFFFMSLLFMLIASMFIAYFYELPIQKILRKKLL